MVRTLLATASLMGLAGVGFAQTVTFTTLGATSNTTEGTALKSVVRIVPPNDPEAKAADAALQKYLATDPRKPGTVSFSKLYPYTDMDSVSSDWVLTGLPYSATYSPYGGYGQRGLYPYTGLTTVTPYYSTGYSIGAGAFQSTAWPGTVGPNGAANTTVITNTYITNNYRNTRVTPSIYSTGYGGLPRSWNSPTTFNYRR